MKRTKTSLLLILMALFALPLSSEAQAQSTLRMNASQRLDKWQKIEVAG